MKKQEGITLLALVVTIVVMVLIAGTTINYVIGENGLMNSTQKKQREAKVEQLRERLEIERDLLASENFGEITVNSYIKRLEEKGILLEGNSQILQEDKSVEIIIEPDYVFFIQTTGKDLRIEYEGKVGQLLPRVLEMQAINRINSIIVKVQIARANVIEYSLKKTEEAEYKKYQITQEKEYIFENLDKNTSYDIKIVISNEKGETEKKVTVNTNEIPLPEGETINIEEWTNQDVMVTLPKKDNYSTQYSMDTINWVEYKQPIQIVENSSFYYRFSDGVNNGQNKKVEITNIDKTAPTIECIQTDGETKEYSKTIRVNAQDEQSGIAIKKYAVGTHEIEYFIDNGVSFTEDTFTVSTQSSNQTEKNYTVYVKNGAGIGTVTTITIENLLIANMLNANNGLSVSNGATADNNTGILSLGVRNACQYGPYWDLPAGTYQITYTGSNLPNTKEWYLAYNTAAGEEAYEFDTKEWVNITGAEVSYKIVLPQNTKQCEFVLYNLATENVQEIKINSLQIKQLE